MTDRELPKPEPVKMQETAALLLVLTNVPDAAVAESIAAALVDERLAACVNILAPCRSIYRWQGAVEHAEEFPLLIKTATDRYPALQQRLVELHPYETPEIVAWRPDGGSAPYASWVIAQTRRSRVRR